MLVQNLEEAQALETTLLQTLTAHIAMTPAGPYRDVLERHRTETADHARALQDRLRDLGSGRGPLEIGYGLIQTALGQAFALGKAPLDLLRGASPEEKLFKNAKDEIASEALEIATYDGIEALATSLGDETTAALARAHRAQEERTLEELRALVPSLAAAVLARDLAGIDTYDASTTGAADAVRKPVRKAAERVREAAEGVEDTAADVESKARPARKRNTAARRASGRNTRPAGNRSSGRDKRPAGNRSSGRDTRPAGNRSSGRDTRPADNRS
jgi:ferritin-like metal-binding protein YciE